MMAYKFGEEDFSDGDPDVEGEVDDILFDDVEPISDILLYIDYDLEARSSTNNASIQDIEKLYEECAAKSMELYIVTERGMEDELLNRIYEHSSKLTEIYNQTQIVFIKTDEAHDIVMKRALGIFYFSQRKNEYLSKNFAKLLEYNKFVLHKKFDSYTALLDVLNVRRSLNHPYENDGFIEYYKNLDGGSTLPESNAVFDAFYQEHSQKKSSSRAESKKVSDDSGSLPPPPISAPAPGLVPTLPVASSFVTSETPAAAAGGEEEIKEESKRLIQIQRKKSTIFRTTEHKILNVLYTSYININYMKDEDPKANVDIMVNNMQKYAIMQNCLNPAIDIVYIYHCDSDEDLMKDFIPNLSEDDCKKIRFLENTYQDVFMVRDAVEHANQHHPHDIIYLIRADCYIAPSSQLSKITVGITMDTTGMRAYSISRSERLINGHVIKDPRYLSNYYAIAQDLFIFQSPLKLPLMDADGSAGAGAGAGEGDHIVFKEVDLYEAHHELIFNKILEKSGYRLFNDSESVNVLRMLRSNDMTQQNLDKREIVKPSSHKMCKHINYAYLPESKALAIMSVQEMIEKFHITEDDLYHLKRHIYLNFCR